MASIGVVIGRFQAHDLHPGHHYLIAKVMKRHESVCILVGTRNAQPTVRDPLDFETRRLMIEQHYPAAVVMRLDDCITNKAWSLQVDGMLAQKFPGMPATLYGSRDSFVSAYSGAYPCKVVSEVPHMSATALRTGVARTPEKTASFRAGVIYGAAQRFPTSYQTVDIAVLNTPRQEVLLARKEHDAPLWRFIGGFVDPHDATLEYAARREASEETGMIEIGNVKYCASVRIPDFRYRGQQDQIMTSFFTAEYIFGRPVASDDIVEVAWHPLKGMSDLLMPHHKPLGEALTRFIEQP